MGASGTQTLSRDVREGGVAPGRSGHGGGRGGCLTSRQIEPRSSRERLFQSTAAGRPRSPDPGLKPTQFDYHAPSTVDEAASILAERGENAKVLAGGRSLIPMLALRLAVFDDLVDIGRIGELRGIERRNGSLSVGPDNQNRGRGQCQGGVRRAAPGPGHASDRPLPKFAIGARSVAPSPTQTRQRSTRRWRSHWMRRWRPYRPVGPARSAAP